MIKHVVFITIPDPVYFVYVGN